MDKQTCENCRYWERIDKDSVYENDGTDFNDDGEVGEGHCKRYPPVVVSDALRTARDLPLYRGRFAAQTPSAMVKTATIFPVTFDCDWCGEHQPTPQAGVNRE